MKTRINSLKFNIKRRKIIEKNSSKFFGKDIPITDFFNGFELPGSTYSGGPTVVADNTGTLVTSPNGVLPIEGMRLATTVAAGAVLGPELFTGQSSTVDNSGGGATIVHTAATRTVQVTVAGSNNLYPRLRVAAGLVASKTYRVVGKLVGADGVSPPSNAINQVRLALGGTSNNLTYISGTGVFSGDQIAAADAVEVFVDGTQTGTVTIAELSVREVIPTWLPTTPLGAQIHPSTPLRTRKGTVSVYGEDFRGPLIEPPRTNLLLASNNIMDTTAWITANVSTEIESTVKYKGNNTNKITVSSTYNNHYFYPSSILINPGIAYTLHAFFKKGNGNFIQIMFGGSRFGLEAYANVDLSDGSFGSIGASLTRSIITDMGDGWYLVEITATATSFGTSAPLAVAAVPAKDAVRLPSFLGAGEVFYYYNLQFEVGSFATSPIVTAATTVTRDAKNLTRPTAGTALESKNNYAKLIRFRPKAGGQTAYLFGSYIDANNSISVGITPTTINYTKKLNGTPHIVQADLTHAVDTLYEAMIYQHSIYGMGISTRYWNGSVWSNWTSWEDKNDSDGKLNAMIASNYQIGALNNTYHICSHIPICEIIALPINFDPKILLLDWLSKKRI